MDQDPRDDVDRLYVRLRPIEPPADFLARVAGATYAAPRRAVPARRRLWLMLDAAALVLLAVVSVWFGMALEDTGALDVLTLLLADLDAVRQGFGGVALALLSALPWPQLLLLAANAAAVAALSRLALGSARGAASAA